MNASPNTLPVPVPSTDGSLPTAARTELAQAVHVLENPSLAARLAAMAGTPIDALKRRLPEFLQSGMDGAVRRAIETAWGAAVRSKPGLAPHGMAPDWFHRGLAAASGAAGGAFGLVGTLTELPVSTTILLRQIASEAKRQGEDPADPAVRAECLKVFALGGDAPAEEAAETGYFAARLALARLLPNAAANLGSAVLPGFLGAIAARFTGAVGLKLSAQAVPVLGAAAGVAVNLAFLEHFRGVARAHFTVRRLEATYGAEAVRTAYDELKVTQDA